MATVAMTTCKWMEGPSTVEAHLAPLHSLHPWHCQAQAPALPSTLMDLQMVLASSCVPLLDVLHVMPPHTSLTQPLPPAWTALLASSPLGLAQPSWLIALAVLLGSISKLGPAPPVLSTSTSLSLAPPPAWSALLASSPMPLAQPSWQTVLSAPLGPTLQAAPGPSPLAAVCAQWLPLMMVSPASRTQLGTMK